LAQNFILVKSGCYILSIPTKVTLNEFNGDTHMVILDSKDKMGFHLVGRLETGTNSYIFNLALSIIAC
jgi:hypothetical protein